MDELVLCRRGEPVQTVSLSEQIVEVGRGAHCDVVVHERGVPETAFWLRHHRGRTLLYDQRSAMQQPPVYWGLDEPIFLGEEHSVHLERKTESKTSPLSAAALLPAHESAETERSLGLLVGVGSEARLIKLREAPLTVGTRSDCDVRLYDDTVSGRHLRVARMADGDGVVLRDLGSRNGTWVSGIRVVRAQVGTHALIRVGRTDLHVVERRNESSDADARSWIAVSNKMLALKSEVSRIAPLSWPVLIHGESGVGKELIARALHEESSRANGPFVTMNAGSFSSHLIDSQLFGHQRGAFTGASSLHRGVFEQAHCGTLFLDEIGELPLEHQARLLRTLESGEIRRVGDENSMQVDVRLICATHRNIQNMVEEGTFRRDLYYRLARLIVSVPPLRERAQDIEPLVRYFLSLLPGELKPKRLSEDALSRLMAYRFPGNVRELRNVLSAAAVRSSSEVICDGELVKALCTVGLSKVVCAQQSPLGLEAIVKAHRGNVSSAARTLGMPRSTLRDKLRHLDLEAS